MNRYPFSASRLTVRAGGRRLLEEVDLEVAAGEWLGLIGPNGAGKTTLFRALLGQVSSSGQVTIEGANNPNRRQRALAMAFVPQRPVLPPAMTVAQYVLLGRTPHISYLRSESDEDLAAAADAIVALQDEAERRRLKAAGLERARHFSNARMAAETLDVYRNVLEGQRSARR